MTGEELDRIEAQLRAEAEAANADAAEGYTESKAAVPRGFAAHPSVDRFRLTLDDYSKRPLFDSCVIPVLRAVDRAQQSPTPENVEALVQEIWSIGSIRQRRIERGE